MDLRTQLDIHQHYFCEQQPNATSQNAEYSPNESSRCCPSGVMSACFLRNLLFTSASNWCVFAPENQWVQESCQWCVFIDFLQSLVFDFIELIFCLILSRFNLFCIWILCPDWKLGSSSCGNCEVLHVQFENYGLNWPTPANQECLRDLIVSWIFYAPTMLKLVCIWSWVCWIWSGSRSIDMMFTWLISSQQMSSTTLQDPSYRIFTSKYFPVWEPSGFSRMEHHHFLI